MEKDCSVIQVPIWLQYLPKYSSATSERQRQESSNA